MNAKKSVIFFKKTLVYSKKTLHLHSQNKRNGLKIASKMEGTIAQLVEQRTENPCVAGSNPAGTTKALSLRKGLFYFYGFFILKSFSNTFLRCRCT
jgi:hypothetical protein